MGASFVVYIDESGDEGFKFNKGSSEWFVLSAVITRKIDDLVVVKLVDNIRDQFGKSANKPLHFRELKHEQRLPYIDLISTSKLRIISILTFKRALKEPEKFQERYRLYFYMTRYLLERVSWFCRDHKISGSKDSRNADIIFSNRSGMSYRELKEYLNYLKSKSGPLGVSIDWSVVDVNRIAAYQPSQRMGLQIADAIASSYFFACQRSKYGFTEDRYARMLKAVTYQRDGQRLGYGLKFWPRELDAMVESEDNLKWVRDVYK